MYTTPVKSESQHRADHEKVEFYDYIKNFLISLGFGEEEAIQKALQIQNGEITAHDPNLYRINALRELRHEPIIEG